MGGANVVFQSFSLKLVRGHCVKVFQLTVTYSLISSMNEYVVNMITVRQIRRLSANPKNLARDSTVPSPFTTRAFPEGPHRAPLSLLAVYKSAISQAHDPAGQTTLGNLPIVSRFMKGIFRSTPPKPRLWSVWKVVDALNWVRTLEPIETLSLTELTQKRVLLVALTSAARAHELAKLSLDSDSIKTDSWEFFLSSQDLFASLP